MLELEFEDGSALNPFLPKQFTAPPFSYTLAHAITPLEENKSFLEKVEFGERLCGIRENFILERSYIEDKRMPDKIQRDKWRESPTFEFLEKSLRHGSDSTCLTGSDSDSEHRISNSRLEPLEPQYSLELEEDNEADFLQFDEFDMSPECPGSEVDPYIDPDEIITSEDRERILEMGRSMFESLIAEDDRNTEDGDTKQTEAGRNQAEGDMRLNLDEDWRKKRKRRKLPDIPKDRKPLEGLLQDATLFDELTAATPSWETRSVVDQTKPEPKTSTNPFRQLDSSINQLTRDVLSGIAESSESSSLPPALLLHLVNIDKDEDMGGGGGGGGDIDSGNSTSHSPEEHSRHVYRELGLNSILSPISPSLSTAANRLELLDPTHRGLHRFVPRHHDEIGIDIGDPVYVQKEAEDYWCEGINLRTGLQGIFPEAHVVDVEYNDFDPSAAEERKERYILEYLGSVRCTRHKGTQVIIQAVQKSAQMNKKNTCVLEIGEKGIKMVNKTVAGDKVCGDPNQEYFFHLKNVTFCGFHPKDHRYFAFITKHPSPCVQEYACHVFSSENSTRCVAEAYGRAFHRFYKTFIDTVFPTQDLYLE